MTKHELNGAVCAFIIAKMEDYAVAEFFEEYVMATPYEYQAATDAGWNEDEMDMFDWLMENIEETRFNLGEIVRESPEDYLELLEAYDR